MPSFFSKLRQKRAKSREPAAAQEPTAQSAKSGVREEVEISSAASETASLSKDPSAQSLPPEHAAETSPILQARLWNQAYDAVRVGEPDMVEAYEQLLTASFHGQDCSTSTESRNEIGQTLGARSDQMKKLVQAGLDRTAKQAAVEQGIADGMRVISAVRDVINKGVEAAPQAAVAWVGICFAIDMLSNPISEAGLHRSGIVYVVSRMDWYWNLAELLLAENRADKSSAGLRDQLEKNVLSLFQQLLAFQIKSACTYHRNKATTFLRDMFLLDDWGTRLNDIKSSEAAIRQDAEQFNNQEIRTHLQRIASSAQGQESKLQDIHGAIKAQTIQQREIHEEEKDNQCLQDLRETDPRDDKTRIEQVKGGLLQDSCNWILHHAEYHRWRDDPDCRLMWIKADPGKGKTMLLCSLINDLAKSEIRPSYFFCQATEARLNKATAVLRGLIYLLVTQRPLLISHVRAKYDEAGKNIFEDLNAWQALSNILLAIVKDPHSRGTVLVIDALDECADELPQLLDLIKLLSAPSSSHAKIIVSSRNWLTIEETLADADNTVILCLEELEDDPVSSAVQSYIQYQVGILGHQKKYKPDTRRYVFDYLNKNANNTFLWVALVCKDLASPMVRERHTINKLKSFPPGLDLLYKRMLDQIYDSLDAELCQAILSVISVVYRPVASKELAFLHESLAELQDDIDALEEIIRLCGSFLTFSQGKVAFIHQSAKDFLITSKQIFPSGVHDVHRSILQKSFRALGSTLKQNMYELPSPCANHNDVPVPDPDPLAAIRYSSVYLLDHVKEVLVSGDKVADNLCMDTGAFHTFLQQSCLYWFEALILQDSLSKTLTDIQKFLDLCGASSSSQQILSLIHDAQRFLMAHRNEIEASPLQLYHSALLFSPKRSLVRKLFEKELPASILARSAAEEDWGDLLQSFTYYGSREIAYCPTGRWIASVYSGSLCQVMIWDTIAGSLWRILEGHSLTSTEFTNISELDEELDEDEPNYVLSVAFSRDGSLVAYGLRDGTIWVWHIEFGSEPRRVQVLGPQKGYEHDDVRISYIAFSNDGTRLASASRHAPCLIWDIATGSALLTIGADLSDFTGPSYYYDDDAVNEVISLGFSTDDSSIVSCSDSGKVVVWDSRTGKRLLTVSESWNPSQPVEQGVIAYCPSRNEVASGYETTSVRIWNYETGSLVHLLEGHTVPLQSVCYSSNGDILASSARDGTVKIWNAVTGACLRSMHTESNSFDISLSPDAQRLTSRTGNVISIWDASTQPRDSSVIAVDANDTVALGALAHGAFVSRDLSTLALRHADNHIDILDTSSGARTQTINLGGEIPDLLWVSRYPGLTISDDGRWLAAISSYLEPRTSSETPIFGSNARSSVIQVWDLTTTTLWRTFLTERDFDLMAFTGDSRWLVVTSSTIRAWVIEDSSLPGRYGELELATGQSDEASECERGNQSLGSRGNNPESDGRFLSPMGQRLELSHITPSNERTLESSQTDGRSQSISDRVAVDGRHTTTSDGDQASEIYQRFKAEASNSYQDSGIKSDPEPTTVDYIDALSLASSKDGQMIAVGPKDEPLVNLYDVKTWNCICKLQGHRSSINQVAFSDDSQFLCSGSGLAVRIWSIESRTCLKVINCPIDWFSYLRFAPGSNTHLSTSHGMLDLSALDDETVDSHDESVYSGDGARRWKFLQHTSGFGGRRRMILKDGKDFIKIPARCRVDLPEVVGHERTLVPTINPLGRLSLVYLSNE